MKTNKWIGVDLDGTLAKYDKWRGINHIGEPIQPMIDKIKKWRNDGIEVRIFTARVNKNNADWDIAVNEIQTWCEKHIGEKLPVTCEKDFQMIEYWDDRAIQVVPNIGIAVQDLLIHYDERKD